VEALILGLDDIGERYLRCARECLDRAIDGRILPFLGWDPEVHRPYWDDSSLNYHHAIAYQTRYDADCLLERGNPSDLASAIEHIEQLIANTDGLSGPIATNRERILCTYLWLSCIIKRTEEVLCFLETDPGIKERATLVKRYGGSRAYLRMLQSVARYVTGDADARGPARKSLQNLLVAHQDVSGVSERVRWPSEKEGFEWAYLWECAFCIQPSARHAIEILRGEVRLED